MKMTQSQKKVLLDLQKTLHSERFCNAIEKIRKENRIPESTLPAEKFYTVCRKGLVEIPDKFTTKKLRKDVYEILESFSPFATDPDPWYDVLLGIIFYNLMDIQYIHFIAEDIIEVMDVGGYLHNEWNLEYLRNYGLMEVDEKTKTKRIALFFSPHISRNDLIDFIEKKFAWEIEPLIKQYRQKEPEITVNQWRFSDSRKKERDEYVFLKHREGVSAKKIKKLLSEQTDKFGNPISLPYINEIIRKEKRNKAKQRK